MTAFPKGKFVFIHVIRAKTDRGIGVFTMYFNPELFFRAEYWSLVKSPLRLRRWAYVMLFTGLYGAMWLLVALGRAFDHVLFPGFRRQAVREPVFIVAAPRSGTTLTQKLLSLDEERFVHIKLYQTVFPSITWQRFFEGMARLDSSIGQPLARLMAWMEKRFFGGLERTHQLRFDAPEGDEGFFVYTFVTQAIYLLFPHVEALYGAGFPDALRPKQRQRLMRYYRTCVQRQLYAHGPKKVLLAKATQSCGAVESLQAEFPDARFVTLTRHPGQSVASHVSLFHSVWRIHSPEIRKDSPTSASFARLGIRWIQHLRAFRGKVDPQQYWCIDYRDLVSDPKDAVEKLYHHFGWKLSDSFQARLTEANRQQLHYRSEHHYSLEEFGLSLEWLQAELEEESSP
jgi:hypothetical protein